MHGAETLLYMKNNWDKHPVRCICYLCAYGACRGCEKRLQTPSVPWWEYCLQLAFVQLLWVFNTGDALRVSPHLCTWCSTLHRYVIHQEGFQLRFLSKMVCSSCIQKHGGVQSPLQEERPALVQLWTSWWQGIPGSAGSPISFFCPLISKCKTHPTASSSCIKTKQEVSFKNSWLALFKIFCRKTAKVFLLQTIRKWWQKVK